MPRWPARIAIGVVAIVALPTAALTAKLSSATLPGSCMIFSVIDGDTVRAWCPGTGPTSVRLLGYDTPEVTSPHCFSEWLDGTVATGALILTLVRAETVELIPKGHDRYGRALARLVLDGRDVAATMVEHGHARRYDGGRRTGWCG